MSTGDGGAVGNTVSLGAILLGWVPVFTGLPWIAFAAVPASLAAFIWYLLQIMSDDSVVAWRRRRRQRKIDKLTLEIARLQAKSTVVETARDVLKSSPEK